VESKHIRTFSRYRKSTEKRQPTKAERTGEKTVFVEDFDTVKYRSVGILPFSTVEPNDIIGEAAYNAFSLSLDDAGDFQISKDSLKNEKVNIESTEALAQVVKKYNLDGVFIGNLSGNIGGSRLLQVKFYGKDREGFVMEKVTRIPSKGNLKKAIDKLVASTVQILK